MVRLCFRITPEIVGTIRLGPPDVVPLLCERLGLDLGRAKALVSRAAFVGEEVGVEVPSPEVGWQLARELEVSTSGAQLHAWVERGRLGQDDAFELGELVGRRVERVLGVFDAEREGAFLVLYVKTDEPPWHRLFLDAGFACWEDWGGVREDDEGDAVVTRDLGAAWGLVGEEVTAAGAGPNEARGGATIIELRFASGARIELSFADPASLESSVVVSFERPAGAHLPRPYVSKSRASLALTPTS